MPNYQKQKPNIYITSTIFLYIIKQHFAIFVPLAFIVEGTMEENSTEAEAVVVLFHAALLGRTDIVTQAVSALRSSVSNNEHALSLLISTGRGADGATPLHLAAEAGNADVIRALLNAGADVSVVCRGGEFQGKRPYDAAEPGPPQNAFHVFLFETIAMGRVEGVRRLLIGGLPVDARDGFELNDSTLHWAVSFSSAPVLSLLLSHGADVNTVNAENASPLHVAAKAKNAEIVAILVREGGNVNLVDAHGFTPLKYAIQAGDAAVLAILQSPPPPTYPLRTIHQNRLAEAEAGAAAAAAASEAPAAAGTKTRGGLVMHGVRIEGLDDEPAVYHPALLGPGQDASALAGRARRTSSFATDSTATATATAVDSHDVGDEGDGVGDEPLLVLWPPAQRQRRLSKTPLCLDSSQVLLICVASQDIDIFPLLTWSGLMDILDRFGFSAQVKRTAAGCKLRLCVDPVALPGRHRFEIIITEAHASLLASDSTGLLYAVHAFVQLVQLHSDVVMGRGNRTGGAAMPAGSSLSPSSSSLNGSGSSSSDSKGSSAILRIPSIAISDWPDMTTRSVLWSHRNICRSSSSGLRDLVELLSRLRINVLQLVIDPFVTGVDGWGPSGPGGALSGVGVGANSGAGAGAGAGGGGSATSSTATATATAAATTTTTAPVTASNSGLMATPSASQMGTASRVFALYEVCSRYRVELVPTVIVSSLHHGYVFHASWDVCFEIRQSLYLSSTHLNSPLPLPQTTTTQHKKHTHKTGSS